ncbi:hypothetical protein WA556_004474 [Blastocystis sp. ATCC 50177/Nand II]
MKAKEQTKGLLSAIKTLQRERRELQERVEAVEKRHSEEVGEWAKKHDTLLTRATALEKERNELTAQHEKEVCELQNQLTYSNSERTALQHLCEAKTAEIESLKQAQTAQTIQQGKTTGGASESIHQEQMAYLDTKMQKVLQRMNDVRVEFEQATTTIAHYQELCNRYHDNSIFLFQLLTEAIGQISRLKKELGSQQPVIVVKQESQQPVVEKQKEPPLPVVVPICEKIDGYEKQIAVLQLKHNRRRLQLKHNRRRLQLKHRKKRQL